MMAKQFALAATLLVPFVATAQEPMRIRVDFTDGPRRLIHVTEQIPVHPGLNTFSYPQWIPGQELAGGPIDNLTGIVFHAGGREGAVIPWRRDLSDSYSFHVRVPEGVGSLSVAYDILEVPSRSNTIGTNRSSSHVVMLEPSDVVLYPSERSPLDIPVTVTIHLPKDWSAATALRTEGDGAPSLNGPDTTFKTVSLEQFVDSPILAGDHCRQYPVAAEIRPVHTLDVCAEKAEELELQPALLSHFSATVEQATKLFGSHHYDHYDFLVADSPHLQGDSEEHTQSADYVVASLNVGEAGLASELGYLLPHEFTHSWCGKYRRPAGVATRDYHTPMQNDLLWVYEGLTEYYGDVLAVRSGFFTPAQGVQRFNYETFSADDPGRRWRTLQDTADASAVLRGLDPAWANWRLTQNYYQEGVLLWLEADMKIRELSGGSRSLDDFAALFFGPEVPGSASRDTGPGVLPYTFTDVVKALNTVVAYDWESFWKTRLNALNVKPATAGLEAAGYSYINQETMSPEEASYIVPAHAAEMLHSLGFQAMADGTLQDVWMGSPAYAAGLGPGDKLTGVNGKPYTAEDLTRAVREAKTNPRPIVLTATRDDESHAFEVKYHDGEKYAALVRNAKPDTLKTAIFKPR